MKKFILLFVAALVTTASANQDSPADACNPSPKYYDQIYTFDCMPRREKDKDNEMVARTAYLLEQINILKADVEEQKATIEDMNRRLSNCVPCFAKR